MFTRGEGDMFDWLCRSQRDMSDCGLGSPVSHLDRCGILGRNLLAIHVNYVGEGDATLLARRKVTIVHCPRSHSFFRHAPFEHDGFSKAGINICLGTDSLASVYQRRHQIAELNLFEEMRVFAANQPKVKPRHILEMVTLNPARALGFQSQLGELSRTCYADLIAVPFEGKTSHVYEAVLNHHGPVAGTMIKGQWAVEPNAAPGTMSLQLCA